MTAVQVTAWMSEAGNYYATQEVAEADTIERLMIHTERDQLKEMNEKLVKALKPLIDDDTCWFDHHGFCQAHTNQLDDGRCAMAVAISVLSEASKL